MLGHNGEIAVLIRIQAEELIRGIDEGIKADSRTIIRRSAPNVHARIYRAGMDLIAQQIVIGVIGRHE